MQRKIPCVLMRGGTSRGPYFLASDLPADPGRRDAVLLSVMGSPHSLQVDGIGGSNTLTSKVAIVSRSRRERSEERRVGKECRSRWWRYQIEKKGKEIYRRE